MLYNYPPHWGLSGHTLPWLIRLYRRIIQYVFRHHSKGFERKTLLIAQNQLMLSRINEIVDLVAKDTNITWYCTTSNPPVDSAELIQDIHQCGYTYVHPYYASIHLWDLIIVADHSLTQHFNKSIPTLCIDHGLGDSKLILGSDERYHYARCNVLTKKKQPAYTCIFESSERRKIEAIKDIPVLKDHISVVGHIVADKIIMMNQNRAEIRRKLGYTDKDIVFMICSTHGKQSMMDSIGPDIIEQALHLPENYKLILSAHFLHWQSTQKNIGKLLLSYRSKRVRVCEPKDDFISCLVASDIGIFDFTSASLIFSILNRPVVYIPFPHGIISKISPLWHLYSKAPRVNEPKDLNVIIQNSLDDYPTAILQSTSSDLVSYPGEASKRIKQELYRLLNLPQEML